MRKLLCLWAGAVILASCNRDLVYSRYQATGGDHWGKSDSLKFEFSAPDTLNHYHLFINVRNDDHFPFSNLFLIASLNFPDGRVIKDTLEYEMALPDGTWMGKGSGSVKENKLWYKENIIFPLNGVYTLDLVQAMRKNGSVEGIQDLPGITDVGLEIEHAKSK